MKRKEEIIEKTIKETHVYYEAIDGTKFDDESECRKYDDTALAALRSRIKKLFTPAGEKDAWECMGGYEDSKVVAVAIPKQEDITLFMQWVFAESPHLLEESFKARAEYIQNTVETAYRQNDVILLGINCDDDYYFINSVNNIISNLNSFK